jgi:hypothetical protein
VAYLVKDQEHVNCPPRRVKLTVVADFSKPCKINRLQTRKDSIPTAVRPRPAISPHPPQPPAALIERAQSTSPDFTLS